MKPAASHDLGCGSKALDQREAGRAHFPPNELGPYQIRVQLLGPIAGKYQIAFMPRKTRGILFL